MLFRKHDVHIFIVVFHFVVAIFLSRAFPFSQRRKETVPR